jgi:hypothetical protein
MCFEVEAEEEGKEGILAKKDLRAKKKTTSL